ELRVGRRGRGAGNRVDPLELGKRLDLPDPVMGRDPRAAGQRLRPLRVNVGDGRDLEPAVRPHRGYVAVLGRPAGAEAGDAKRPHGRESTIAGPMTSLL